MSWAFSLYYKFYGNYLKAHVLIMQPPKYLPCFPLDAPWKCMQAYALISTDLNPLIYTSQYWKMFVLQREVNWSQEYVQVLFQPLFSTLLPSPWLKVATPHSCRIQASPNCLPTTGSAHFRLSPKWFQNSPLKKQHISLSCLKVFSLKLLLHRVKSRFLWCIRHFGIWSQHPFKLHFPTFLAWTQLLSVPQKLPALCSSLHMLIPLFYLLVLVLSHLRSS